MRCGRSGRSGRSVNSCGPKEGPWANDSLVSLRDEETRPNVTH